MPLSQAALEAFVNKRRDDWGRLADMILRLDKGKRLERGEIGDFGRLYRRATGDLAFLRSHIPGHSIEGQLNSLVGRAHGYLYRRKQSRLRDLWDFYTVTCPALIRHYLPVILASAALFWGGAIVGAVASSINPDIPRQALSDQYVDMTLHNIATGDPCGVYRSILPELMGSAIAANNIMVSFYAFALGVSAGLGTVWILTMNGFSLGALTWVFHQHGQLGVWLTTVMIHGTIELTCVCVAGAAGLLLTSGFLFPGLLSRREAFKIRARKAIHLMLAVIPWLVVAAFLESFVTPKYLEIHSAGRIIIIVFSAAAMVYYARLGRGKGEGAAGGDPSPPPTTGTQALPE